MSNIHSLDTFLSTEESKLLDLISKSALSDDKKFELEYIVIPSVREVVQKILQGYLSDESDLRLLGDPKVLPKVLSDIEQEDGWSSLGSMKRRMIVRGVKWKEEMEEGYKDLIREKMKEMYSLEEWMNLIKPEKSRVKIMIGGKEKGLSALATILEIEGGDPVNNNDAMQNFLRKIYTKEEFEKYLEGVKKKMRELYSLEGWMNLTAKEKGLVKIMIGGKEKGLITLATFFKTDGNPTGSDADMQKLLEQIYSSKEFSTYYQEVKERFKELYTLEEWMNLTNREKEKTKLMIGGKEKGLMTIATLLKTGGNPSSYDTDMQKLLEQIYSPEEFSTYYQEVKERFKAIYTLEEWMNLTAKEKGLVKIMIGGKEKGLITLATFFKTGGNPSSYDTDIQKLLEQIYSPEEFSTYYQEVKERFKAIYTLEEWMNLTKAEKSEAKLMIGGKEKGLITLATFFKTGGNSVNNSTDFKNLMIAIYGPEEVEKYSHLLKTKSKK